MKKVILPLMILLSFVISVKAQSAFGDLLVRNGLRDKVMGEALRLMPSRGDRPEDFVPPHWKIAQRTEGDINRDGKTDYVLRSNWMIGTRNTLIRLKS